MNLIKNGMTIGLGSGSTVDFVIAELGRRVQEGLAVTVVPASQHTADLAKEQKIPLTDFTETARLDLAIDGADEVDPKWNLVKGGGGALVRERIVLASADTVAIVVDSSKLVKELGQFPLPIEVVPFAWQQVHRHLETIGRTALMRGSEALPFVSDNGNYILDCHPSPIPDPLQLYQYLTAVPGIVDAGIICGNVDVLIVGYDDKADIQQADGDKSEGRFSYL